MKTLRMPLALVAMFLVISVPAFGGASTQTQSVIASTASLTRTHPQAQLCEMVSC